MEASSNEQSKGSSSYDGKIAGLYDLEETLGSGHFAVVKLARHVFTGAKVAVKVVDKTKLDEVSKSHLFQEVRCMKLVQHPNVVRLYEVIDTQTKLYLVLELGDGGDLYDYIMKHEGGLSEDLARKYFKQILRAITYCHELHVVHRDLKPENVVFFEKLGVVKLTDFGFSNKFSPGQKLETFCGSLAYSAPEILLGDSYDAPAVDIWSLGVILYMLVCGQPPFEKANDSETLTMIMDCKYTVPPQISQSCRQLISSMLVRDPKKRANLQEIAAHPWLKECNDFDTCDFLPLVSRQELSDEDHAFILQKMVNGNIATKDEIMRSLDKDIYNYITATYFLLAEIRLRKHREDEAQKQKHFPIETPKSQFSESLQQKHVIKDKNILGNVISINVVAAPISTNEVKLDKRTRKCSIVREEEEEDSVSEQSCESNALKITPTKRESISDTRLNKVIQEHVKVPPNFITPLLQQAEISVENPVKDIRLQKFSQNENVAMVDNKKDQIIVEDEVEDLQSFKELEIGNFKALTSCSKNPVLTHRRSKLHKIRTPSCSSSEASDDDTKAKNKKKINKLVGDTPKRFRMHRRDSHDDSSDSQDHPTAGTHGNTQNLLSAGNSYVQNKKEGQTHAKDQNKSEDNKKSTHSHTHRKKQHKENSSKHIHGDKQHLSNSRRRIRESQSLDRITEAQEYDGRSRGGNLNDMMTTEQRNSLSNLSMFSVAEIKEEYEEEPYETDNKKDCLNATTATLQLKHNTKINNIYNLNTIQYDKSFSKTIQVTGSKCYITIKKIRRLGKYFPAVNFS